jgi:hypothetical protein
MLAIASENGQADLLLVKRRLRYAAHTTTFIWRKRLLDRENDCMVE